MENKNTILEIESKEAIVARKRNKAVGITLFTVAAGHGLLRIIAFFISILFEKLNLSPLANDTLINLIFSIFSQILICFLIPLLIYMLYQKQSAKEVFYDANFKKPNAIVMLLCIPLAVGFYLLSLYLASYWLSLLTSIGYTYTPSSSILPSKFNPLMFILSLLLTAILPAFCEEFLMRGVFLTSLRQSFGTFGTILLSCVAFGLFHQNIVQIFYTAVFGGYIAFLVIRTKSIYPGMLIHFLNNTISVYLEYDDFYNWGVSKSLESVNSPLFVFMVLLLGVGIIVGITFLILKITNKQDIKKPLKLYKPSLKENAGHIGAIVITACATLLTFFYGFIL